MDRAEEMRRRIDAALGYGRLSQDGLADQVSFTRSTLNRKRDGTYEFTDGDLFEISEATGVPVWFLRYGWDGWRQELSHQELQGLADSLGLPPPSDPPSSPSS